MRRKVATIRSVAQRAQVSVLQDRQVDRFIFVSITSIAESAHLLRLKEAGAPLVVINRPLEQSCDLNQIHWNDWEAGYLATKHLLNWFSSRTVRAIFLISDDLTLALTGDCIDK